MAKFAWVLAVAALTAATAAAAQNAVPDLRGTWKGESESIILGGGNAHHAMTAANEPELRSVAFTLTIDKQDGRASPELFHRRAAARKLSRSSRAAARSF
jgi:hypothetical protein